MITITKDTTKSGRNRIIIELENGETFKGYSNGNQYQFNGKNRQTGLCSLPEDNIKSVFEKANTIANYNGDYISYLNQFKSKKVYGTQRISSKDGKYLFGYYHKQSRGGIVIYAKYNENEHSIRPAGEYDEKEANEIIHEICEEYNLTGKFKSERRILRGQPFPDEYFEETGNENLSLNEFSYSSIISYILKGFDDAGHSLLESNETLTICSVDGFEITVSDLDSLRVNDTHTMVIIHSFDQPENELIIPIDKISRVLLSRE